MREICIDSSLGVPKGKRVQRQVRYERLKDEFLSLINTMGSSNIDSELQIARQSSALSQDERADF